MNNYLLNTRLYCPKGRRIAVFGQQIGDKIEIFELYCSKNDQFCKSLAKSIYSHQLRNTGFFNAKYCPFHPKIYLIDIKEGDTFRYTFEQHCLWNYHHLNIVDKVVKVNKYIKLTKNGQN
jgi:hypothetical protein